MKKIKGLVFVIIIAQLAGSIGNQIADYVKLEVLTIGIILGIMYSNTVGVNDSLKSGIDFSLKKLLKLGIILLGFKIDFLSLVEKGPKMFFVVVLFVPFVLTISYFIGRKLKLDEKLSMMVGIGSSICGASAIVAMTPLFPGDEKENDNYSVISVSIVSFLGAIGVLLYSQIGNISNLNDMQFGLWSGLSLHGVAHALAGAFSRGDISGEFGTVIKMMRVMMLVPVSLFLSMKYSKERGNNTRKIDIPYYVLLFILVGIINTIGIIPEYVSYYLKKLSSYFILMSMISMGLKVNFRDIKDKGKKAIVLGSFVFLVSSSVAFMLIKYIF